MKLCSKYPVLQIPVFHDEDIDWWSKYYASVGRLDKCKQYLEQGYDKIQVTRRFYWYIFTYPVYLEISNESPILTCDMKATQIQRC